MFRVSTHIQGTSCSVVTADALDVIFYGDRERYRYMKPYEPKPIEISDVELPAPLLHLAETLAESVHDMWAQSRLASGWTYGPERDDTLKHSPCLVPYAELPESEKAYDRDTAIGTLKAILKLGFKITEA